MFFDECPIGCNSNLVPSEIVIPECTLMRCDNCGQLLSSADVTLYENTMKRFDDIHQVDTNPRIHLKRLNRVKHYWRKLPSETRFVDVGCSFGMFLKELKNSGFNAEGVEPSGEASQKCKDNGFNVHYGFLEDIAFADNSIDAISLYEVVEHLKNPRQLIEECFRVLNKGGMLFITTGNSNSLTAKYLKGKWDYFSMEDGGQGHISFFNPKSISLLSTSIGFKVHAIESRRVKFVNKKYDKGLKYVLGKITQETFNPIAKAFNVGHDMLIVLEK